jgi:transcription initiation factor TFIIB
MEYMTDGAAPNSERSREEHLRKAFSSIERIANRIDLDITIINLAESTYEQFFDQREYPIDDIEDTALACLYIAAKFNGNPILPEDITEEDPVTTTRKSLLRRSKDITSDLSLESQELHNISSFVDRICDNLEDADESVRKRAKEIVDIAKQENVASGKKPAAVAAAAIYNASLEQGKKTTQAKISSAADVTEVTIRNRYQEQRDAIHESDSPPSDPHEIINWYSERIGIPDRTRERAHTILACGENDSYSINQSSLWAAAALRRASEEYDDEVSMKALKEPIAADSQEINSRKNDLKESLRSSVGYRYSPKDN